MKPITDFRIDTVEISEAGFYSLPLRARELIGSYATPIKSLRAGYMRFELPIQRWDEILPLLDHDTQWVAGGRGKDSGSR
jgi:hypothetical protein